MKKKTKTRKKNQVKKVRAIIYDIKNGKPYFLIFHRVLRWKGWETLKETIEKEETPRQAIERGIKEETKLRNFEIIKKLNKQEKWQVQGNRYFIVATFLVRADMYEKISLKQEIIEHDKYQWASKKVALKKITWPKTKKLLKEIRIKETKNHDGG